MTTRVGVVVYTSGNWDLFHIGHLLFLERARALGDYLVVAVGTDECMVEGRGKSPVIPFEQRCRIVEALECVDEVVPWQSEMQGVVEILKCGATIRACNYYYAQDQPSARAELERRGITHVLIPRTRGISSTEVKEACYEEVARARAGAGNPDNGAGITELLHPEACPANTNT